jgi:hypothetical protein
MGIMIVGGFAALVAVIAGRVSHRGPAPAEPPKAFARQIDIPRGTRIEAMTTGADRLVLGLELPNGNRQLLIMDLTTGARLGTVELHAGP